MANIDHAAALKAAKKRVWYLENRKRILAESKAKRDAVKVVAVPVTQTVEVTKVNGQYTLQLNGVKLVLSADNQVTISQINAPAPADVAAKGELKSNGQPYKTTAAQRASSKKYMATRGDEYAKRSREYYAANRDAELERKRAYSKTPRGKEVAQASAKRYKAKKASTISPATTGYDGSKLPAMNSATLVPFGQYDVSEFSMIRNILK